MCVDTRRSPACGNRRSERSDRAGQVVPRAASAKRTENRAGERVQAQSSSPRATPHERAILPSLPNSWAWHVARQLTLHAIRPLGLQDELRAVLRVSGSCWGYLCLHREAAESAFSPDEARFVPRLAPHLAEGIRVGLLRQPGPPSERTPSPGLLMLTADGSVAGIRAIASDTEPLPPARRSRVTATWWMARRRLSKARCSCPMPGVLMGSDHSAGIRGRVPSGDGRVGCSGDGPDGVVDGGGAGVAGGCCRDQCVQYRFPGADRRQRVGCGCGGTVAVHHR